MVMPFMCSSQKAFFPDCLVTTEAFELCVYANSHRFKMLFDYRRQFLFGLKLIKRQGGPLIQKDRCQINKYKCIPRLLNARNVPVLFCSLYRPLACHFCVPHQFTSITFLCHCDYNSAMLCIVVKLKENKKFR